MPQLSATSNRSTATEKKIRAKTRPARPAPAKQPGPIPDAENRKVAAYKRTRPYYRANEAAFQHRPEVKRIKKRVVAAKKTRNKAAMMKAYRGYQREQRHGPDQFSNEAYRYYTGRLWNKVKGEFPNPEKRPGFKADYGTPKHVLAFVNRGSNKVHYNPSTARQFMGRSVTGDEGGLRPNPTRTTAQTTPLHEWTHTRQSKKTFKSKAKAEGGATANEQRIARKFHMPDFESTADYERWAAQMRRRYGRYWIREGQFH